MTKRTVPLRYGAAMQTIIIQSLQSEFGLSPVMAAEIECYVLLADSRGETLDAFWGPVRDALIARGVSLLRIEKEAGDHQYELVTHITSAERLAEWLEIIRDTITAHANRADVRVTFDAKAFSDQPASGLHLHLHLADGDGINAYHKTEEWTSDALRWSLGGLLADLPRALPIFCPGGYSMYRFDDTDHVPKLAGWGVNNRYCALRIPAIEDHYNKRIEHRVPGADADPRAAIEAMLHGVLLGLRERIEPPEQEHGKPTIGLLESLR
ncbi:MAG: hypothetical protein DI582_01100 [Azospirillum brasilense]|nr:MAG: hypothetical protein DI582_01100 [Azospirillum brasilense]